MDDVLVLLSWCLGRIARRDREGRRVLALRFGSPRRCWLLRCLEVLEERLVAR